MLALFCISAVGCSNAGPKKYVFFGEPQPQKVELFEDYWTDYPFRPDDPSLPLRRGKGGVIRFFKKNSYSKSILVDGELTVNVYFSTDEGVTLTQPDMQLVVTSEQLNQEHRKFEKETGYTYHVYLDLGEYDQPEEEITILSAFKDAKTGQVTLSHEIRTTAMGTTPLPEDEFLSVRSEVEKLAEKRLGEDSENPIVELQKKYSAKNRAKEEEAAEETRLRKTIRLENSQFEDINGERLIHGVSYLEEAEAKREVAMRRALEENNEKTSYYRDLKRKRLEDYTEQKKTKTDELYSLRDSRGVAGALNFQDASKTYSNFQEIQQRHFQKTAEEISNAARAEYEKDPESTLRGTAPKSYGYNRSYEEKSQDYSKSRSLAPQGFSESKQSIVDLDALRPSEMDKLDDFQPERNSPATEIYVRDK